VFVAVDGSVIAGTAEYVIGDDHLYLQGVAVRRDYRGLGVCRSLVTKAEELARNRSLRAVTLCAIEETGNVAIFERLGFQVRNRVVASDYLSVEGNAVTQVDLVREIT
jgi:ribosomal protein S18 acetylase RimI-like enzyme